MSTLFTVSKTYDVITSESASRGDYAESDFVFDARPMSLREVLSELDDLGYYENFCPESESQSLYTCDVEHDYTDGTETRYALHITGSPRAMKRLNQIIASRK